MTPSLLPSFFSDVFWVAALGCFFALLAYDLLLWLVEFLPDFLQVVALFVVAVWGRIKS